MSALRTLWLHIGHEKTGSTFIQSLLRANTDVLASEGITYPLIGDEDPAYRPTHHVTPSGNGRYVFRTKQRAKKHLKMLSRSFAHDIVLSSEMMFDQLLEWHSDDLVRECAGAGFERVAILLFVRAPAAHAASTWQQRVKGWQAETRDLDQWVREVYDTPAKVARFLTDANNCDGLEVTVRSFDCNRPSLANVVAAWLGLKDAALVPPAERIANRSLTSGEVALQLALNRTGKLSLRNLGHALVEGESAPPGEPRRARNDANQAMLERLSAPMDEVDRFLLPKETYDRGPWSPFEGEKPLEFNDEQMTIIAHSMAEAARSGRFANSRRRILRRLRLLRH